MRLSHLAISAIFLLCGGCASYQARYVEGVVDGKFDGANSIRYMKHRAPGKLHFESRIAGSVVQPVMLDSYRRLHVVEASWGELRLHSLPNEAALMSEQLGLAEDDRSNAVRNWSDASINAMQQIFAGMPSLSSRILRVDVYLSPVQSGRQLGVSFPVTDTSLHVAFLQAVDERGPEIQWGELTQLIVHEMLHIHYRLADLRPKSLDEELAAYVTGMCGQAWMISEAGVKKGALNLSGMDSPVFARVFPNLLNGEWAPRFDRFKKEFGISEPTAQGRMASLALFYHQYASDGVLDITDRDRVAPLLEDCRRLPLGPPKYSKGETHPPVS